MTGTRKKWNEKYATKSKVRSSPDPFLKKHLRSLKPGTALDLACGDGRNSIFLAEAGFEVCGVDISDVGLDRLAESAGSTELKIATKRIDLEDPALDLGQELDIFDNIVVSSYKPSPATWNTLPVLLNPGGVLLLASFNINQHIKRGFPENSASNQMNSKTTPFSISPVSSISPAKMKTGTDIFFGEMTPTLQLDCRTKYGTIKSLEVMR